MEIIKSYVTLIGKYYVIMKSKLTLNIDKDLSERAKAYAKSQGQSLSSLVENFFSMVTREHEQTESELTPRVKLLAGSLKNVYPEDFDYKKELQNIIFEKHSRDEEDIS